MADAAAVADAVESVLPEERLRLWRCEQIPIGHHEPDISNVEIGSVQDAVRQRIGTHQPVKAFEATLRQVCQVEQAVAVSSGTCALQLALMAAGVKPGDEVIVPALTFAGTANAVCAAGATPHFIDAGLEGIRPLKLRQYLAVMTTSGVVYGRKALIKAAIAVHVLGIPCDVIGLQKVCDEFGIPLIEDAAEALGSSIGGKPCGGFGACAVLSFNNNKIVTTNGGGAVLTNDAWIAAQAWSLATTARLPHSWLVEHDAIAFNFRMGDINAALGLAQLARLEELRVRKSRLADAYRRALAGVGHVQLVDVDARDAVSSNHWLNAMVVGAEADGGFRDEVLKELHARGILARCLFTPLHRLPHFQAMPRSDKVMYCADNAWKTTICLPSGAGLAGGSK